MVSIPSLWMPMILAAVGVFVVSALLHMVLRYHNTDFAGLPNEDEVMTTLGAGGVAPGDYMFPHGAGMEAMKDPAWLEKYRRGPAGLLTILPPLQSERPSMTKELGQWFAYCLVVSLFAAYLTSRALPPGADFLAVLRFAGTTAFMGYSLALVQQSIWWHRKWSTTWKSVFDGLVYAVVTGAIFGWLWP